MSRAAKLKMDMAGEPTLFTPESAYEKDKWIIGNIAPKIAHPGHSNSSMRKPFVAWDGEGYTDEFGFHHYWLLANSLGDKLIAPPGRSLERYNINKMFHRARAQVYGGIHVGFALGYDFTMMLRANGIKQEQATDLRKLGYMTDEGYVYRLMMGKQLTTWEAAKDKDRGAVFNLQDTWGFFQRSFIKALDEYFPDGWPYRDIIVEMKAQRAFFDREHDEDVMRYNDYELELLVMLMEELRNRLYTAGMPVSRWYGPGAIAQGLMQDWKIKDTLVDLYKENPNLAAICQHAYAGGRFELVKPGHVNKRVYQYDINSAYPAAIAELPNLRMGEWKHANNPDLEKLPRFSVVRIRWTTRVSDPSFDFDGESETDLYPRSIPFPLWRRTPDGRIHYPSNGVHGWYWLPEVLAAIEYGKRLPAKFGFEYKIEESYGFYPMYNNTHIEQNIQFLGNSDYLDIKEILGDSGNSDIKPFSVVNRLYETRQILKANGNGAHIGIKLGLNSLYGKFAQQVGYNPLKGTKPPFHNMALAGYITASCRAKMIEAMMLAPEAIIAFETDGIFSTKPLDLPVSNKLGEWDLTEYDDMYYFQSGFRFGIRNGEIVKPATRGIPVKDISLDAIISNIKTSLDTLTLQQTQFLTLQWATAMNRVSSAGQWKTSPRVLRLMNEDIKGKRIHDPDCPMCNADKDGIRTYSWNGLHLTIPACGYENTLSEQHPIIWVGQDSSRSELDDILADDWDGILEP